MKVLIIDDEKGVLWLYEQSFKAKGITIFTAENGEQGLEIAKKEKPDAILLDIIMPRQNGLDVLKMIKQDEILKEIPVYLLTNLPMEASGSKPAELGAAGYFVKAEFEPNIVAEKLLAAQTDKQNYL